MALPFSMPTTSNVLLPIINTSGVGGPAPEACVVLAPQRSDLLLSHAIPVLVCALLRSKLGLTDWPTPSYCARRAALLCCSVSGVHAAPYLVLEQRVSQGIMQALL